MQPVQAFSPNATTFLTHLVGLGEGKRLREATLPPRGRSAPCRGTVRQVRQGAGR